jgi:hypothetical protein
MLMKHSRRALRRLSSQQSIDAHRVRSPNVAEPDTMPNDNAIPFDPSAPLEVPRDGWDMETESIPEVDLSNIWDEVLRVRPTLDIGDEPRSSLQGTNDAGSFVSARESEKTDHSIDDEEVIYNPATDGLSPESLLKERFLVDVAKNGKLIKFQ